MVIDDTGDAVEGSEQRPDRSMQKDGESEARKMDEFAELQEEIDKVGFDDLTNDPEYLDFAASFDQFEMSGDEIDLESLIELEPDASVPSEASSDESREEPTDDPQSDLVSELTRALESDTVSDAQRAELRDALGLQNQKRLEVQVNHLKSRFFDLEAYIQAIEDLFDADTSPCDEIEPHQDEVSMLRSEIEALDDELNAGKQERTALADQQENHTAKLTSLEQSVKQTRDAFHRNLAMIEMELKQSKRWRNRVSEAIRDDEGRCERNLVNLQPDHD